MAAGSKSNYLVNFTRYPSLKKDVDDSEIREQTYAMNASRVSLSNDRYIALQVIVRNQQQTTKN